MRWVERDREVDGAREIVRGAVGVREVMMGVDVRGIEGVRGVWGVRGVMMRVDVRGIEGVRGVWGVR